MPTDDIVHRPAGRDLTSQQLNSLLRDFRPAGAAFILHLSVCDRCCNLAARFLSRMQHALHLGSSNGRLPFETDFAMSLSWLDFYAFVQQAGPELDAASDLPLMELLLFLQALNTVQASLVRHLTGCSHCRKRASEALNPNGRPRGVVVAA